jgi:hypothetical protein
VRILAVAGRYMMHTEVGDQITYQLLSGDGGGGGTWGPIKRSGKLTEFLGVHMHRRGTVVCGGAVHWLAGPDGAGLHITCTVALDVRTGRTWTTLPLEQCQFSYYGESQSLPATAGWPW